MPGRTAPRVVVVGGGAGGLAAAVDCARLGAAVQVLERAAVIGGKVRQERVDGQPIDAGPTVLTMRWVFEQLFADAGEALADHVHLQRLALLARHAWQDGGRLDLHADREATAAAIAAFASPADAAGYLAFCRHTEAIYQKVQAPFIRSPRPTLASLVGSLGLRGLPGALGIDVHRTMWKATGEFFRDPRLRQLFARYATYYGSNPFEAPATLNLIAHVEQAGVWAPQGGMTALIEAIAGLAGRLGVELRGAAPVATIEVEGGRVQAVRLASGERLAADVVIFGGDLAALASGLLGRAAARAVRGPPRARRSLSALTWCLRAEVRGWPLAHHNVLFSRDYAAEFAALFGRGALAAEPTVYMCAPDRLAAATAGPERLFVLVNAPPRGGEGWLTAREIEACERATWGVIERCGLSVARGERVTTTPDQFAARFPGSGGGLYGTATRGVLDALSRPTAATRVRGLYVAGGSVHPGAGVPMATLSGRFAAATACADLRSTGWSLRAATSGGTSTRSATTVDMG